MESDTTNQALTLTAFGALSPDLRTKTPFPEGKRALILSSETERRALLGRTTLPSENVDLLDLAKEFGLGRDAALAELKRAAEELSARLMKTTVGRDYLLIQAVNSLDDMNVVLNTLTSRLREIYGIHYPELSERLSDNESFAREVCKLPKRPESSVGIEISDSDLEAVLSLAKKILSLFEEKKAMEKYVEGLAIELAPKASESAGGGALAARLISRAGSLERLAFMPSSTIQVLGAEKALFKHLTRGSPCPKHGIIFQHPSIQSAPKGKRGKIARNIAARIAISCRQDYFSKN